MSILQFSEHFQLIFDNSNVKNNKQIKQKMTNFFFLKTFQNYQIFLPPASEEPKIASTNLNSSAFLLQTCSMTCSNVELFSIFSQYFLELIFTYQNKNNVVETISCFFNSCQKNIAYIMCLNT